VKLLIKQLGPENLLAKVEDIDPKVEWENKYAHQCQACTRIFADKTVLKVIHDHEDRFLKELAVSIGMSRLLSTSIQSEIIRRAS
jgi:hypothetical protein